MTERSTPASMQLGARLVLAIAVAVTLVPTPPLRSQGTSSTTAIGTGTIRGRVVDASSKQPLSGVRIQVPSHNVPDVFTNDDGRFSLPAMAAGRHELTASKAGYVTVWRTSRNSPDFQIAGPPVDVAAGESVQTVDFVLPKGSVIAGRVVDTRGREVIGARVYVSRSRWRDGDQVIAQTNLAADRTNDLGEFRLFGLPAGTYLLGVTAARPTADGVITVYYPGSFGPDAAESIAVRSGEERTATITMPPPSMSSIVGTVRREDGQPEVGVYVNARRVTRTDSEDLAVRTGTDGSYRFASLLPGEYEVFAMDYVPPTETRLRTFARARVAVDNNNVSIPLMLTTGGTIRGRYRFDTGAPPADINPPAPSRNGVDAVAYPQSDAQRITVQGDWSFAITGVNGTYRFRPYRPAGWSVKQITRDGQDITYATLAIGDETIDGVEVLLSQKVTGLAVSLEGTDAEVDDVTVVVFAEDESKLWPRTPFIRSARTIGRRSIAQNIQWHDGRSFTMSGLPPARYYAVALARLEPGQETSPTLLQRARPLASRVELVDAETRTIALKVIPVP